MTYFLVLFSSLVIFWLLLSGYWSNGLLIGLGITSSLLVAWLGVRAQPSSKTANLGAVWRLIPYWWWLMIEIVKSNRDVVRRIWWPERYPISPSQDRLALSQETPLGRTIYAQSITLTPGTVAIEVAGGKVLVHALTREGLEELRRGEMDRRVSWVERGRR
ncbi:MAG: cation transporter [Sphingobacteriia bacterium]|nr:cation transporter [Sphingobacteriia bacterium]NCC38616.1 cation transporter [Gammaproteobacteria bacterium]